MPRRSLGYLHKNRHGTFAFRWRPPRDLAHLFNQRIYAISLGTKCQGAAWHNALRPAWRMRALVEIIRVKRPKNELITTELIRRLVLSDGTKEEVDYDPTNPDEVAEADRIFDEVKQAGGLADNAPAMPDPQLGPSPATTRAREAQASPTIREAFKRFCTEKRASDAWKDPNFAERYDYGPIVHELIAVAGDRSIGLLSAQQLRALKDKVLADGGSSTTMRKKLGRLKSFLDWARESEQVTSVSTANLRLPKRAGEAKPYEPFNDEDLKKLFESDSYRLQTFEKASEFWIPLLGLYTGARINELAQLHLGDVTEQDGIPILCIDDEENKATKNAASKRKVPVHRALIEAGFLEYHATIAAEGWTRLFPELTKSQVKKNAYGKEPSRFFTQYRRACGVSREKDRKKVFHSFRTTANSVLRYADVPQERRERLIGHESDATNNRFYRPTDRDKMFPMATLLDELSKLDFGLTHTKYAASLQHRSARLQAARRRGRRGADEPGDAEALRGS